MNSFNPKVTIIIPVFNGSNYLHEAIDSALAQTYKNLEIIVVNDGSKDDGATERVALQYGDKIRYFSKENGGTSTALNLGIRNMRGEYFSWLSHDDLYTPDKIEVEIQELAKLEDKNTIMMSDLDGIDESYQKIYQTDYIKHIEAYPPRKHSMLHPIIYNQTHGCTLLIPKACFDVVGLFDEKELVAQDFEFFYRAFSKFPHKLIPKVLVTARDSSNRQGRRSHHKGDVEYSRLFIKMIEEFTQEEIEQLAPTRLDFYLDMRQFFKAAQYSVALNYINSKLFSTLQISSYDLTGNRFNGHDLHLYLRERDLDSRQLVLYKQSKDDSTYSYNFLAPNASKDLLRQSVLLDSEVVHLHLAHNIIDVNYFPLLARIRPTVITLHDPFYLGGHCVHSYTCDKWKTQCYDCEFLDRDFRLPSDISTLNFEMKRMAIQNADISAIVASNWMKEKVEASPIWKGKKIYSLPFGIDQELFRPGDSAAAREALGIPKQDKVLLFRSDVWDVKGTPTIIDALKKLKNSEGITLVTVGTKSLLGELADRYNIVEFGWVHDNEKMVQLYQACDLFLMPSRQETFGMMAIEAMSCGKAVLVTTGKNTALPEVVHAPDCGVAVAEEEYAHALETLLGDMDKTAERAKRCYEYARAHYSKEKYLDGMLEIYRDVKANWVHDEQTDLLVEQLRKYPNDLFSVQPISERDIQAGTASAAIVQRGMRGTAIRIVRRGSHMVWNLAKRMHLTDWLKKTKLYQKLNEKGVVRKFRG